METSRIWKFNRGEWTEAYVFMKLLGDGRIYGATANLQKDSSVYIDIIEVIRYEMDYLLRFKRSTEDDTVRVYAHQLPIDADTNDELLNEFREKDEEGTCFAIITAPELSEKAAYLYRLIHEIKTKERRVDFPEIQDFLTFLKLSAPKATCKQRLHADDSDKSDILIKMQDSIDNSVSTEGFSIKSHLGSSPTLFNASDSSNLTFEVVGCTEELMHKINAEDSLVKMIDSIKEEGLTLNFLQCKKDKFLENIQYIDTQMDKILQVMVLIHSGYIEGLESSNLSDVAAILAKVNPLNMRNPEYFYKAKLKDFLFAAFSGMTASNEWRNDKNIAGGYIDVNKDGELLYYRAVSNEAFCSYLFTNTFIDRPDRGVHQAIAAAKGKALIHNDNFTDEQRDAILYKPDGKKRSQKCNFGYIYQKDDKFVIDLNFQIRFR